jgi:hypothetical protein
MRLRETVDRLGDQLRSLVGLIPALVALAVQPEVRGQVHDLESARAQLPYGGSGGLVGVGHQRGLGPLRDPVGIELLQGQLHAVARIELVVGRAGVAARRHDRQLE